MKKTLLKKEKWRKAEERTDTVELKIEMPEVLGEIFETPHSAMSSAC